MHQFEVPDLIPGTRYYYRIQLWDEAGHVKFIDRTFQTLRRKITCKVKKIWVLDDGDNLNSGEARFEFRVVEVANPPRTSLPRRTYLDETLAFPASGYQDVDSGHDVPNFSGLELTAGPNSGDWTLWIYSRGREEDTEADIGSYEAAGVDLKLDVPAGRGKERIAKTDWYKSVTTGSFNYSAFISYAVEYV